LEYAGMSLLPVSVSRLQFHIYPVSSVKSSSSVS
jgi:hypothetical protein